MSCKSLASELVDEISLVAKIMDAGAAVQVQLAFDGAKKISIFNAQDAYLENAKNIIRKLTKEVPNCTTVVYNLENTDKLKDVRRHLINMNLKRNMTAAVVLLFSVTAVN